MRTFSDAVAVTLMLAPPSSASPAVPAASPGPGIKVELIPPTEAVALPGTAATAQPIPPAEAAAPAASVTAARASSHRWAILTHLLCKPLHQMLTGLELACLASCSPVAICFCAALVTSTLVLGGGVQSACLPACLLLPSVCLLLPSVCLLLPSVYLPAPSLCMPVLRLAGWLAGWLAGCSSCSLCMPFRPQLRHRAPFPFPWLLH